MDELKKNMFGFINTWIDNYYKNNKSSLLIYSQNYQKALVAIVESPQTNEDDKNGIYHLSAARELRGAIKSLKEEYRRDTYNRYATNGCINMMRLVFEGIEAQFTYDSEAQFLDGTKMKQEGSDAWSEEKIITLLGDLGKIIDYFFDEFSFIKKRKYRKEIMQEIKRLCDKSQQSRDFFLSYYESRFELFNELFSEYPEHIFITQGKYKRYEVVMDIAEKLEISMQDKPEIEVFFADKPEPNQTDDETDEKAAFIRGRYAFSMEEHQIKLIHAFDSFTQRLLGEGQDYQIYNFWPNETLDRRIVRPVGPYIAVAFKRDGKWYMLIDGIYERCAIYIWTGENLIDGLSIFTTNKGYARQQPNVCHLNHRGTREAYEITYLKALSKIS